MPAGKIRAGNIADLSGLNQAVERAQYFLDGGEGVESVKMVDVDVIGAQTAQTGFAGLDQVMSRRAQVIRPFPHPKCGFRGNQNLVAAPRNRFAQNFLREAFRVNVGGVKQVDAGLETDRDEAGGFGHVAGAPAAEKLRTSTKRAGAKTEGGNFQSRTAKLSKFHSAVDAARREAMRKLRRAPFKRAFCHSARRSGGR